MKKIKLKLEYQCFPVWLYDENDNFIDNELPDEIIGDVEIDPLCVSLQEQYDSLYKNDGNEFAYVGFENTVSKNEFLAKLIHVVKILNEKIGKYYEIENSINIDNL